MGNNPAAKLIPKNSKATQTLLAFASLVLLIALFSIASPNFFRPENLVGILLATAVNGILAVGITFIIVTGGIDLSIGYRHDLRVGNRGRVHHHVALSHPRRRRGRNRGGSALRSHQRLFHREAQAAALHRHARHDDGYQRTQPDLLRRQARLLRGTRRVFAKIATMPVLGIPMGVVIFFATAIIASFVLSKTILGRYTFAISAATRKRPGCRASTPTPGKWASTHSAEPSRASRASSWPPGSNPPSRPSARVTRWTRSLRR